MLKLTILVLFSWAALIVSQTTEEPAPTLAEVTSTARPANVSLNEAFKKAVEQMKQLKTDIRGWDQLQAGTCRLVRQRYPKWTHDLVLFRQRPRTYRCFAYIPKSALTEKLSFQFDIAFPKGTVSLIDADQKFTKGSLMTMNLLDFWSDLRDQIFGQTNFDCQFSWGDDNPNHCRVSIGHR